MSMRWIVPVLALIAALAVQALASLDGEWHAGFRATGGLCGRRAFLETSLKVERSRVTFRPYTTPEGALGSGEGSIDRFGFMSARLDVDGNPMNVEGWFVLSRPIGYWSIPNFSCGWISFAAM